MSSSGILNRRRFVFCSSASSLLPAFLRARPSGQSSPLLRVSGLPDLVSLSGEEGPISLQRNGSRWQGRDVEVRLTEGAHGCEVNLHAPSIKVLRTHLRWQVEMPTDLLYLGDHWERSYGDLAWRSTEPERVMPWYFLAFDGHSAVACGVKTGSSALCFWQVDPAGVSLWLDVRNGGRGVRLGKRELHAASVVTEFYPKAKPFAAAKQFCGRLCETPRLPHAPIYGGNNWYYAYGKSSAEDIRGDSERIASFAPPSQENRPFMVIDDGWQPNATVGPWSHGNAKFPDMAQLASEMRRIGVQAGLWMRTTSTKEEIPTSWRLQSPNAARQYSRMQTHTLDPTVPEVLESMRRDVRTAVSWGYQLIKHDYSTYDLIGQWGFNMGAAITDPDWGFADGTRTNAEVIKDLYRALREAAGSALLIGCNTVGHLGAGLFELQRIGDDTSGQDWNRTRKMGVNTLAFRAPQHGTFFAVDADCVGLTKQVPWNMNRQWLDLLARSGTPLFVSAAPDAVGPEQRAAIREAFANASKPMPLAEPMDWLRNSEPQEWVLGGQRVTYQWFEAEGVSPFAG